MRVSINIDVEPRKVDLEDDPDKAALKWNAVESTTKSVGQGRTIDEAIKACLWNLAWS